MKKRIMLNARVKIIKKAHAIKESYERVSSNSRHEGRNFRLPSTVINPILSLLL
jgi:hypothetical protein